MKKHNPILSILIVLFFISNVSAQDITIDYHLNSRTDISDFLAHKEIIATVPPEVLPKMIASIKLSNERIHSFNLMLYPSTNESNFKYDSTFLPQQYLADYSKLNSKSSSTSSSWIIYQKNHRSKKITLKGAMLEKVISDDYPDFRWEIKKDSTKNILGYSSILATGYDPIRNKEISAYFTFEIPVSDGPMYFCGLPGLILEVQYNQEKDATTIFANDIYKAENEVSIQKLVPNSEMRLAKYFQKNQDAMRGIATVKPR